MIQSRSPKSRKLRVGITGAGVFGGFHANKMVANPQVDFVGIYDPVHPERAVALAKESGATPVRTREELIEVADALIIASPATAHGRQAVDALEHGLHVLVEKPIATDMETAREMVMLADRDDLVLQVGHQERFVCQAIGLDKIGQVPKRIVARRCHPFASRGSDVSVTMDLMVHDLDMVTVFARAMPRHSQANTLMGPSGGIDETRLHLRYQNGTEVDLLASRMVEKPERTMELIYDCGRVHVDFLTKTIIHDTPFDLNLAFAKEAIAADSLGASDAAFVDAVLHGSKVPVSGIDGARALMLALEADKTRQHSRKLAV